jgi:ubiquitin-protein ligase
MSGLSKRTIERLKIEFRFLKHINDLLQTNQYKQALEIIKEYYHMQICNDCGNKGWCTSCSKLELLDKEWVLECIDDIYTENFKFIQQITVMINAPKGSPYEGNKFQINIDIPDAYPKAALACFFMQPIRHINIEQKAIGPKHVRFSNIFNHQDWKPGMQIFQVICSVIELLVEPDNSQNFFPQNQQNCQLHKKFKEDVLLYKEYVILGKD